MASERGLTGRLLDIGTVFCLIGAGYMMVTAQRAKASVGVAAAGDSSELVGTKVEPLLIQRMMVEGGARQDTVAGPALIYVFKSDCPACAAEKPEWIRLVEHARGRGIRVFAITASVLDSTTVKYFGAADLAVGKPTDAAAMARALGLRVVPTTVVLGTDNTVLKYHAGLMTPPQIEELNAMIDSGL
jgi:thiol-disulfide isomerase/thioredoxin